MKRHAHMVDLLRPDLTLEQQIYQMSGKQELTPEDFDLIIQKAEAVKKAAETVRKDRYGK